MASASTFSDFMANVVLLGVPQPIIMGVCVGMAVMLAYWGMHSRQRSTPAGLRRVQLTAGSGMILLTIIMALSLAFARAAPGYEEQLAQSRDHLGYLPALLLFGALCAGFVALVHHLTRPRHGDSDSDHVAISRSRSSRPKPYRKPGHGARTVRTRRRP